MSPELQHKFCALWNQIIREMQSYGHLWMVFNTLAQIHTIYTTLHQDTHSAPTQFSAYTSDHDVILKGPFSYPLWNIPGHHPDLMPHIHDISASATIAHTVLYDDMLCISLACRTPDFTSILCFSLIYTFWVSALSCALLHRFPALPALRVHFPTLRRIFHCFPMHSTAFPCIPPLSHC